MFLRAFPRRGPDARARRRFPANRCSWQVSLAAGALAGSGLLGCESTPGGRDSTSLLDMMPSAPTAVDAVNWISDPYDSDKRFRGTVMLANAPFGGEPVYIRAYVEHLSDADSSVRAASAFALGQHGHPDQVPLILPLMTQEDRLVRLNAVRALQRLHNPAAVPSLLDATDPRKETDAEIRAEAASALGQYAEPRVLQGLIAALGDDRLAVTSAAAESLRTLTGEDFGDDRAVWFAWAAKAAEPFAKQREYTYPYFHRDKYIYEYLPFWSPPPNELPAQPAGMPPVAGGAQ